MSYEGYGSDDARTRAIVNALDRIASHLEGSPKRSRTAAEIIVELTAVFDAQPENVRSVLLAFLRDRYAPNGYHR